MHNFLAALIIIPIITWYSMFGVLDRNYKLEQHDVENIVYQYTQIAAKKGILYEEIYKEMCSKLDKYGEYEVYISAEKFEGNSQAPTIIEGWDTIDIDLREQDFDLLNVVVVYSKRHPVSIMYEMSVFGVPNGKSYDFRPFGKACAYIQ